MGMFDAPEYPDWFQDKFAEGEPVKLEGIRMDGGTVPGNKPGDPRRSVVTVTIDGVDYGCTGAGFEQQAKNLKPGDLPAFVSMVKVDIGKNHDGSPKTVKRFVPVNTK